MRVASSRKILWMVLFLALVLRVGFGLTREGLTASSDERNWDGMARAFLLSGLLHPDGGTYRPPLYALMLAGVYEVGGHNPDLVRLVQAVLGTVTCIFLYGIGRRIGGEATGLVAAGWGAVYPFFVFFSGVLMAETLLVFLTTAALCQALRLISFPTVWNAGLLGVVLGLGVLCKPVLLPWAILLLWGQWRLADQEMRSKRIHLVVALAAIGLVVAPWTVRNALVTGHFVPVSSNFGMNLMIGNGPGATGRYQDEMDYLDVFHRMTASEEDAVEKDQLMARKAMGWIAGDPLRFLGLVIKKLAWFWAPVVPDESFFRNVVAFFSSGPLLVLGLWGVLRLRGRPEAWAVGTLALSLVVVHAFFFAHTRFRLPLDAALMAPAALWIVQAWNRKMGRRGVPE
ncbi:MAG: glycosyltransferase family 39 protein [bacterium]|nr:glycosyltransferase family 39 protein [bacterium]